MPDPTNLDLDPAEPPLADECTGCGGPVDDEGDAPDRCLGCSR